MIGGASSAGSPRPPPVTPRPPRAAVVLPFGRPFKAGPVRPAYRSREAGKEARVRSPMFVHRARRAGGVPVSGAR